MIAIDEAPTGRTKKVQGTMVVSRAAKFFHTERTGGGIAKSVDIVPKAWSLH